MDKIIQREIELTHTLEHFQQFRILVREDKVNTVSSKDEMISAIRKGSRFVFATTYERRKDVVFYHIPPK